MSKRFGRNQKRAMRTKIAEFKSELDFERGQSRRLRDKVAETDRSIRRIAEILGENFIGLPPQYLEIRNPDEPTGISKRQSISVWAPDSEVERAVVHSVINLQHSRFSGVLDKLRGDIHFRYRAPTGEVGYSISLESWQRMSSSMRYDTAVHEISRSMAEFLAANPSMTERG